MTGPFWESTLRRWNAVCWVLYTLYSVVVLALDPPGPARNWSLVLLAALAAGYVLTVRGPLHPYGYLLVLVLALSGLSYLRGGYVVLFIVTLPHFWVLTRSWRASIGFSAAGAAGTLIGSTLRTGWGTEFVPSVISTLIVYAASVLIGMWAHRVVEESHEWARLRERERMAREIHDTLAQGFASIVVLAEAARSGLDPEHASARQLRSIEATARDNLAEARELVGSARPATGSMAQTLRRTLDRFAEDTGLAVIADLADVRCDQPSRVAFLRCAQESLANVRRHARASTVGVTLARQDGDVELEITDDGVGFDVRQGTGFGIDGMRRRFAEMAGELTVTSSPGDGTRILARLPEAPA
ncbi:sensor histidine kinase [Actinoplanes sp. G11-F43]|uniref:sensor histidine kinase n=1 Tax=Actinoplanes sp. G11-F43 TaxID=3424130 RepID=UPI003D32E642